MKQPVVVYGASGYTGRLTCEALTRFGIPFIAAGRSHDRLDAVARELSASGAVCQTIAVPHEQDALSELLSGTRVVINTSGPFSLLGLPVVRAALAAGVHYLDITGEQDFMFDVRRDYDARFAQQKLVLGLSSAFLWGPGTAAAQLCLETPGIDTIEVIYAPPSLQTVASLQSMMRSVRRRSEVLQDGQRVAVDPTEVHQVEVPGRGRVGALCVGAGEASFFAGDARVHNCKTYFASDTLVRAAGVFRLWSLTANRLLGRFVDGDTVDAWSDAAVLRWKQDPPREDRSASRFVVLAKGTGRAARVQVQLDGDSPYLFTGFMAAMGAQELLAGHARRFGYVSLAQTLGARHLLQRLEEIGTTARVSTGEGARTFNAAQPNLQPA